MTETRVEFEKRRTEFRGLRNWCELCGAILCCFECLQRHQIPCRQASWSYGMTAEEFERQLKAREGMDM